jgi:uncharacterized metal-binding protein
MYTSVLSRQQLILVAGDIVTLGLVTVFGFASHGEVETAGVRMLTTFLPLVAAWLLVAPHLKVFEMQRVGVLRELWRPFWAMVLAGPMAAWLRGVMLNAPILPIFVIVIGGVSAMALLAWRSLFLMTVSWKRRFYE